MTKKSPAAVLGRLLTTKKQDSALREIANILRSRDVDEHFLQMLANIIDPDTTKPIVGVRLVPKRVGKGAPRSYNQPLAKFIDRKRRNGEYLDAAVSEAMVLFKVSERTCYNALEELNYQRALREAYEQLVSDDPEN